MFAPQSARRNPKEHQDVLKASARYFGSRILLGAVLIGLLAWGAFEWSGANPAATYVHSLATARIVDVPALIRKLEPYRRWADPQLRKMFDASSPDDPERVRAALALLPVDDRLAPELVTRLTKAEPNEFAVICDALRGVADQNPIRHQLWADAANLKELSGVRFRAGAALAGLSEGNPTSSNLDWKRIGPFLASEFVATVEMDPASYDVWLEHLRPIRGQMVAELTRIFGDTNRSPFQRNLSASVLCSFVENGDLLPVELAVDATPEQLTRLLPKLKSQEPPIISRLHQIVGEIFAAAKDEAERDRLARRQAHAAACSSNWKAPHRRLRGNC